jgi:hypothetical protein
MMSQLDSINLTILSVISSSKTTLKSSPLLSSLSETFITRTCSLGCHLFGFFANKSSAAFFNFNLLPSNSARSKCCRNFSGVILIESCPVICVMRFTSRSSMSALSINCLSYSLDVVSSRVKRISSELIGTDSKSFL